MRQSRLEEIKDFTNNIKYEYDTVTTDVNSNATSTFNTLDYISNDIDKVVKKVAVMGDMITDLRLLNGSAKNIAYLTSLPIIENKGLYITQDRVELAKTKSTLKEINASLSSISSNNTYRIYNEKDEATDLDSMLKTEEEIRISFATSNYEASLNLIYANYEQVNTIELELGLLTESYPIINSIQFVDSSNNIKEIVILNTNSRSMDLGEERLKDNKYQINIGSIFTNQIIINFSSKDASSVIFKKVKTFYNDYLTEGFMILGPVHSNTPILKIAINSLKSSKGCSLEISTDQQYWIPLSLSNVLNINDKKKIASFNTINDLSFKTSDNIFSIYLKINLKTIEIEDSSLPTYLTIRENNSITPSTLSLINKNQISAYKVKNSDMNYGSYQYSNNLNTSDMSLERLDYLQVNGLFKCIGLVPSPYSVSIKDTTLTNVGAELKKYRTKSSKIIDAVNYDIANSVLSDVYLRPLKEEINIQIKTNLCFSLNVKEDVYTIISQNKSLTLDLTTPYLKSSIGALIAVPFSDILIKDSIGVTIKEILKEDLHSIKDKEETYYFLNLIGILYKEISIKNFKHSPLYPIQELNDFEYGLFDGKIKTLGDQILSVDGFELIETVVNHSKVISYQNGNYIKRLDENFTYFHEQIEQADIAQTIIKLDKVSIEKGSLQIFEYTDGLGENYQNSTSDNVKYINIGSPTEPNFIIQDENDLNIYLQE